MAKRSSNRFSKHKSINSIDSADLNSDTNILGDEKTYWWNNLEESVPAPIYNKKNETAKELILDSQLDITSNMEWWKNLISSDSEHTASTNKGEHSAVINKAYVLERSTSESEKEISIKKKKIPLRKKASRKSRKSEGNAFANALSSNETISPSRTLAKKQAGDSILHTSVLNREISRKRLRENNGDSSDLSPTVQIVKIRPSIFKRNKKRETNDQNEFQDVLAENDVIAEESNIVQKESSKHSPHRIIDTNKSHDNNQSKITESPRSLLADDNKDSSLKLRTTKPESSVLENNGASNINKNIQNSDNDSDTIYKIVKPKSRFLYRTRKSLGMNAFADALADDENTSLAERLSQKIDIHDTKIQSSNNLLSNSLKEPINQSESNINIAHENRSTRSSSIHGSSKLLLSSATKKQSQSSQIEAYIDHNVTIDSLSSDKEMQRKKRVFLKPKSRILTCLHNESSTENLFEKVLVEDDVLKSKSGISKHTRDKRSMKDLFEKESEVNDDINVEDSTVALTKNNRISDEQNKATTKASQVRAFPATEKNLQLRSRNISTNEEYLDDISHKTPLSNERSVSKKFNAQSDKQININSESTDAMNVSKSVSRKSRTARTPVKSQNFSNRISREKTSKTLEERTRVITSSPIDATMESDEMPHLQITTNDSNNSHDVTDEKQNTSSKRLSKSYPSKETRVTRSSTKVQAETLPITSKDTVTSPKHSVYRNIFDEDVTVDSETDDVLARIRNSAENSKDTSFADKSANVTIDKNVINISTEKYDSEVAVDDENATRTTRKDQQTLPSSENKLNNKKASGRILSIKSIKQISNRIQIIKKKEASSKQQASGSPSTHRNIPMEISSKNVSKNSSKLNSPKTTRTLHDFFKTQQSSAVDEPFVSTDRHLARSQVFTNTRKMDEIKQKLDRMKSREIAAMKVNAGKIDKNKFMPNAKSERLISATLRRAAKKPLVKTAKVIDKAYLVNGKVYKAPKLPRPKYWATDRFYKFLWARMEPRYKLATRVRSEKFMQELAKIVSLIERRKKYDSYKAELIVLMKEMARLGIISTRNDFYNFCYDFLPYEFRVKVVPILLPGNKRSVPYNPENLHTLLLNE